jgi:AraC family transcriptional regulator
MMQVQFDMDTFGRLLGSIDTPGFFVAEKIYSPNLRIPRHVHDTAVMSFALNGSFTESNTSSEYTCEQFGLSVNPAGESHSSCFGSNEARGLVIEVKPRALSLIQEASKALDRPLYVQGAEPTRVALRVYRELRSADNVSSLVVEGLLLELVAIAFRDGVKRESGKPPLWLLRARDYLHANFSKRISLQQIAQVAGVHPSNLSRMFRRHYRRAVGEYVRELRLERSMQELNDPETSLAEIAAAAGFYDQSHFANAFKRHTGLTPAAFRRAQAGSYPPTSLQFSKTRAPSRR